MPLRCAEYIAHVANRGGLVAILFADREYPVRAAFSVLQKARVAPLRRIAPRACAHARRVPRRS